MQGVPGSQGVPSAHHPPALFNPFIYGNDVDSVDIATRVAMVRLSIIYWCNYFITRTYYTGFIEYCTT